ncbi:MAG: AIR synthase family protein [Desulfobacteraceae bacterium]|jgi:hydrogenase expression/formation protein HypE|nr:AIR synthase family protein [Desulfobacteraceae bacterium]
MSKFSLDILKKRVFPFANTDDPDVILGAAFGEDVALTQIGSDILISHVDPIIGAIGNIGWLAVHVACNDIATSGAPPRWILLLVLVSTPDDEDLLEQIMRDAGRAGREIGVSIIGGHTGYSSGLSRPLVAVTALGTASGRRLVHTSGAQIGDHVLITKGIALEGTAILAQDFSDVAQNLGLSEQDLHEAQGLMDEVSIVPEALVIAENGATAIHDVTRGGLLETLLEIAHLSNVAIEVDASRLPMRPVVDRFAKAFRFDPLQMISSGTMAATVPPDKVAEIEQILEEMGVVCADVGCVTDGVGVRVLQKYETIYYPDIQCEEDELARLWTLYPRSD